MLWCRRMRKGSSLMQPLRPQAALPSLGALGSAAFAALAAADVAPEADFFQKYQARPLSWLRLTTSFFLASSIRLLLSCDQLPSIVASASSQSVSL